jgi:hypothetical protein
MRTTSSLRGRVLLLGLFIVSPLSSIACNDDSKTSGTSVQVSEEAKQHIVGRREVYKSKAQPRKEKTSASPKR